MAVPSCTKITEAFLKKTTGEYDLEVMQWLELPNMGIRVIENLTSCTGIRTLTLCNNKIRDICGLEGLVSLERLDLSSNCIKKIGNLGHLTSLQSLDLKTKLFFKRLRPAACVSSGTRQGNQISNVDDVKTLSPLPSLRRFFLQSYGGDKKNPACEHPSYHSVVTRLLPRLNILDGESLNLRKCMMDVFLDNATPDDEALKSPERKRWCEGFDWTPEAANAEVEEDLRVETDTLRGEPRQPVGPVEPPRRDLSPKDMLHHCASLNRRAKDALREM